MAARFAVIGIGIHKGHRKTDLFSGGLLTLGKEKAQPSPNGCHCMSSSKAARSIMQATDKGLDVIVSAPLGRRDLASYRRRQQQGRGMTRDEGRRKTVRVQQQVVKMLADEDKSVAATPPGKA
ncbi:hypothetical protein CGLO_05041 [Colletotrichum gloeosporioides Cg-14]|uniref:Uncharacterized protein n=1 Tax=Colletotrichum gloeosporioides (strain Cg-14) TaxID=1237896 RepID=T0KQY2_COLGC|nr:hypothetical protein CGLO_05041 [Colletotrichum gloeosporioides Cg-14]